MSRFQKGIVGVFLLIFITVFIVHRYSATGTNQNAIVIGAVLPTTGNSAVLGIPKKRAFDIAVDEWNSQNTRKVLVIYEDSKGSPKDGVSSFQKIVTGCRVDFVYADLTAIVNSVIPLVEKFRIPTFAGSAEPAVADASKYLFRLFAGGDQEIELMMDAIRLVKAKSIFVLHTNELYGNNSYKFLKEKYERWGGGILGHEEYPMNNTDFKGLLAKARDTRAERIILLGYGNEYVPLLRQANEMSISVNSIIANLGGSNKSIIELPSELKEGLTFVGPRFSYAMMNDCLTPAMRHFVVEYKRRYAEFPDFRAAYAYDAMKLMSLMCNEVEKDRICEKLISIRNYDGASGKISFMKNGDTKTDLIIAKYRKGKIVLE